MDAMNAVKSAAESAGIPITAVGPAMGKTPTYVSAISSKGARPRYDSLAAMLDVCGYALCAVPKGDVPPSAIIIDPAEPKR